MLSVTMENGARGRPGDHLEADQAHAADLELLWVEVSAPVSGRKRFDKVI